MKNFLIIASKNDKAGVNITTQLSQFGEYDFYLIEGDITKTENLDLKKINQYDYIIFASRHQSVKKEKSLCIHAPGIWNDKICKTSALFNKFMFKKLHEIIKEHPLDYNLTIEATHHGPFIEKPCTFIEIGSGETDWKDNRAGFVIAKTIHQTIHEFRENPYNEIAFAIGGPHYCPNFNKIQLNSNIAISHIIPQYALPLTDEMLKEAITKTEEEIDFALLDWKGLGKSEDRQKVLEILDRNYINYKKVSEIRK